MSGDIAPRSVAPASLRGVQLSMSLIVSMRFMVWLGILPSGPHGRGLCAAEMTLGSLGEPEIRAPAATP